jgi:hypothetical protein
MTQEEYKLVYSGFNKKISMEIYKDLITEQYSGYKHSTKSSNNGLIYKMM